MCSGCCCPVLLGPLPPPQVQKDIAEARMAIEQARLLVMHAAWKMDTHGGAKGAQQVGC